MSLAVRTSKLPNHHYGGRERDPRKELAVTASLDLPPGWAYAKPLAGALDLSSQVSGNSISGVHMVNIFRTAAAL